VVTLQYSQVPNQSSSYGVFDNNQHRTVVTGSDLYSQNNAPTDPYNYYNDYYNYDTTTDAAAGIFN